MAEQPAALALGDPDIRSTAGWVGRPGVAELHSPLRAHPQGRLAPGSGPLPDSGIDWAPGVPGPDTGSGLGSDPGWDTDSVRSDPAPDLRPAGESAHSAHPVAALPAPSHPDCPASGRW